MPKRYLSFTFQLSDSSKAEILIAYLTELGFEGFEETETGVTAFIPEEIFLEREFNRVISSLEKLFTLSFTKAEVEEKNWNEEWERGFKPIIITTRKNDPRNKRIAVRTSFHEQIKNVEYEIIIDPKMSFGTGHHSTTAMMMQLMLKHEFRGKKVLDFGCGTGILSILASKLGATSVLGIDNEEWAAANAKENFEINGIKNARILLSDQFPQQEKFDVILANINLTFLKNHFASFKALLSENGLLFISGFLVSDEEIILNAAIPQQFVMSEKTEEDNWMAMVLSI